jgi:predicted dehydrogenase
MMHGFVDGILKGQLDAERDASFFDGWKAQAAIDAVVESVKQKRWMDV